MFALLAWSGRRLLELAVLCVPLIYCGYFVLSILVFSFGEDMPFDYFSRNMLDVYGFVLTMICFHFFAVLAAMRFVDLLDNRSYVAVDVNYFRKLDIGITGFLFCISPAFFVFLAVPNSDLWERPAFIYISASNHWMRFADLLLFLSAVLTPFIRRNGFKFLCLFVVTTSFLAVGSRSAIVMLIVFAAVEMLVLRRHRSWVPIAIGLLAFWLLGAILYLRIVNSGGILPVFQAAFFSDFSAVSHMVLYGTNYIFNLSFVLNGELLETVAAEAKWFYYSIIPVPSVLYDLTAEFNSTHRFRANIPYPGFGYAISYMGPFLYIGAVFLSSFGFLLARKYLSTRRDIFEAILCFSFFAFPFLIQLQYNLRTGTRLIYVFAAVYFIVAILRRIRLRQLA
ncbi:hypothetical protein [Yoonia litorea]|nr:hypothetical protein [Yoonia litorea]